MNNPKQFFDELESNLNKAKTKKYLRVLEREARHYITSFNNSLASKSEKKHAFNEYKKFIKKVSAKGKEIK